MQINKLTPHIGAEVTGVDLSGDIDDATFEGIHQAFLDNLVLVFRGQDLAPDRHIAFTERFGAVEPHPLRARAGHPDYDNLLVLENTFEKRGARNDFWHSDISCAPTPPAATVLHGVAVPEGRGDTLICNMYRAWDLLDADLRARLEHATAKHSGEAIRQRNLKSDTDGNKNMDIPPAETHPVLRRHPSTGRKALYVNRFFTVSIDGMDEAETARVLEACEQAATRDDNVYRHKWKKGDVLMWDNRCTMHYAEYDYGPGDYRRMHRTTSAGDRPAA